MDQMTHILQTDDENSPAAAAELIPLVYDELRKLASHKLACLKAGQTLQPTALVHEAWLKLVGSQNTQFANRRHFFAAAAEAMRHILIDNARRKATVKHGANCEFVDMAYAASQLMAPEGDEQTLAINEALDKFAKEAPLEAEVVKLRFFVGMTIEEAAEVLEISVSTAKRYWTHAKAVLYLEIAGSE
jgi:RNA polymerase sigma factor (TIGR02999 family)